MTQAVENLPAVGETQVNPWIGKIPWRRKWQPTPVFLPGESHGQRSLVGYSPWPLQRVRTTEQLSTQHLLLKPTKTSGRISSYFKVMPGVIGLKIQAVGNKANSLVGCQATLNEKQLFIRAAKHEAKESYNWTQYIPCLLRWHIEQKIRRNSGFK